LVELGPGRGVLMRDLLRAAATAPQFRRALRLFLVERSRPLRAEQERRLGDASPNWINGIEELPPGPLLIVANEFLDVLPVRQFVRGTVHWAERLVTLDDDRFVFVNGPESPVANLLVPGSLRETADLGAIVEICPSALALSASIAARLLREPGAAL